MMYHTEDSEPAADKEPRKIFQEGAGGGGVYPSRGRLAVMMMTGFSLLFQSVFVFPSAIVVVVIVLMVLFSLYNVTPSSSIQLIPTVEC